MTLSRLLIVLVLASTFAVAGCGGGGDGAGVDTAAEDPVPEGDPIAGRDAFLLGTDPPCGDCHTLADAGTTGTIGPDLDEVKPTFQQVLAALEEGPGEMPSFATSSPQFKDNVAAYVATVAGQSEEE